MQMIKLYLEVFFIFIYEHVTCGDTTISVRVESLSQIEVVVFPQ